MPVPGKAVIHRRVPLARRNLLAEPRRLAAQPGTRNFFGAVSVIPADTVDAVRADPDVDWAAGVRGFFSIVELHDTKVATYVIGSTPGDRGGPWELRQGRAPSADDEVAIGSVMARRHGIDVGDPLEIMGRSFTVVGTTTDAFMASFVFMTHAATDRLLSSPGTTSFVLAGTDDPAAVRDRLEATGLSVLDRDQLARADLDLMARAYRVPIAVMRAVAFAIGSIVIALTAYTAIVDRRREYGIVKAMGARAVQLVSLAVEQSLLIAASGLVAGGLLFMVGRALIGWARPQFVILATTGSVGRAAAAALVMGHKYQGLFGLINSWFIGMYFFYLMFTFGLVAAIVPARRRARLEPAAAYRSG